MSKLEIVVLPKWEKSEDNKSQREILNLHYLLSRGSTVIYLEQKHITTLATQKLAEPFLIYYGEAKVC